MHCAALNRRRAVTFFLDKKSNQKNQAGKNLPPTGKTPWPGFPTGLCALFTIADQLLDEIRQHPAGLCAGKGIAFCC